MKVIIKEHISYLYMYIYVLKITPTTRLYSSVSQRREASQSIVPERRAETSFIKRIISMRHDRRSRLALSSASHFGFTFLPPLRENLRFQRIGRAKQRRIFDYLRTLLDIDTNVCFRNFRRELP